ncbi:MAG: YkgJ family cysteine cluster protein [Methylocella sp.]
MAAILIETASLQLQEISPCRTCGACCSFARDWPRFTTEDDADLGRIPSAFVAADFSGMRCDGNRCSALLGEVGVSTLCSVYTARPVVCRTCEPGDEACGIARRRFGLSALTM